MKFLRSLLLSSVFATGFLCGCSNQDWHAETIPVSGNIRVNGETHRGVYVILVARGQDVDVRGSRPWGVTDEMGYFSLSTYKRNDGCPIGEYTVTIKWPVDYARLTTTDRLYEKFSSPQESKMTVKIDPSTTTLPQIDLNNVKVLETAYTPDTSQGTGVRRPKSP